jgi:pimeloyl-ACP methyl ester carboxylesterase
MPASDVNGVRISSVEAGTSGEPVVLLHCTAGTSAQWRVLLQHLEDSFRVLAPDRYGCGDTEPWTGCGRLTLADEARLVAALAARFADGPFHLVGHSSGGAVALRLALERPDRLRSLTLIEPVSFHLLRNGDAADQALFAEIDEIAAGIFTALASGDYWSGLERFINYWCGAGTWARLTPDRRIVLMRGINKIALDFSATINELTPLVAYRRVSVPTLILAGERSPRTTRRIANLLAQTIPAARLRTVAGAGHMLPLSHPELVNPTVVEHLHRHGSVVQQPLAA